MLSESVPLIEKVRPRIVARLVELRTSLDPLLARVDEATATRQLSSLLDRLLSFLVTRDEGKQRDFVHAFIALRAGEAQGAVGALGTLVAIGDVTAQIVNDELNGQPGAAEVVRSLARVTAATARVANNVIGEDLMRRRAQLRNLARHGGESGSPPTSSDGTSL